MKSVVYHPNAEEEFLSAVRWCEREWAGRGLRLDAMVQKAEQQILRHPRSGGEFIRGTRRLVLARFPYSLIYLIEADRMLYRGLRSCQTTAWLLAKPIGVG